VHVRDNKSAQPSKENERKKENRTKLCRRRLLPEKRELSVSRRRIDRSIDKTRGDLLDAINSLRRALSFFF